MIWLNCAQCGESTSGETYCRDCLQRRELDRDEMGGTTNPPRPEGSREMLATVIIALLLLLAFAITGTMDYQAAQVAEVAR